MPIEVQIEGRDGILEFPDGTDPAVIQATVSRLIGRDTRAPQAEAAKERTWTDTAVDALPYVGGLLGGLVGAPLGPLAIGTAAIGGAGGEGWKRAINSLRGETPPAEETPSAVLGAVAKSGRDQGVAQGVGMGVGAVASRAARPLMRSAHGAMASVRRKFPTVNLEDVALREGVAVSSRGASKAARLSRAANRNIARTVREAGRSGAAPVTAAEIRRPLWAELKRAKATKIPGDIAQVQNAIRDVNKTYSGGIGVDDALVLKQRLQELAKPALQGAADPRSASLSAKLSAAQARGVRDALVQRGGGARVAGGRVEGGAIGDALTRSQELMALDKAMQASRAPSKLRLIAEGALGGAGYVAGGSDNPAEGLAPAALLHLILSPSARSRAALYGPALSREVTRLAMQLAAQNEAPTK